MITSPWPRDYSVLERTLLENITNLWVSTQVSKKGHYKHSYNCFLKDTSIIPGANKFMFVFLLPQSLEMSNMRTKRLEECLLVIVSHTKLLTRFTNNGSDLWIVNLTHAWEQVMSGLMVQASYEWKIKLTVSTSKPICNHWTSDAHYFSNSLIINQVVNHNHVYSLGFVSIEKIISNTWGSVSSDFQTPGISSKIFNSLLGIWKSDETLYLVFDISQVMNSLCSFTLDCEQSVSSDPSREGKW